MSEERGYLRTVLDTDDCRMLAQGLRVFARQLLDECRYDRQGADVPGEVTAQVEQLEAIAGQIGQADGMECCLEGYIRACQHQCKPHPALELGAANWRIAAAAMMFLAERVDPTDRPNSDRLKTLAEKTRDIAEWVRVFQGHLDGLEAAGREIEERERQDDLKREAVRNRPLPDWAREPLDAQARQNGQEPAP